MAVTVFISALALFVSVIVFVDNRMRQGRAERLGRRPALVFVWDDTSKWVLKNIGLGPALDVVALQRTQNQWLHPLHMPELAVGESSSVPHRWVLPWDPDPGLAVRYRSVTGEPYMTHTGDDWSQMTEGWADLPDSLWSKIEPHWGYRDVAPDPPK